MDARTYERISKPIRSRSGGAALKNADRLCVLTVALIYAAVLLWLLIIQDARFWRVLLVPAIGLIAVSILRAALNAPRPYESLDIDPLLPATTHGKSFPSRHVASGALIAAVLAVVNPALGIGVAVLTALLAWIRVVGGVHHPKDVIVGALLGAALGILGIILPVW